MRLAPSPVPAALLSAIDAAHHVELGSLTFAWSGTSFDDRKVKRWTYRCRDCGADFKDTREHLAASLIAHTSSCPSLAAEEAS